MENKFTDEELKKLLDTPMVNSNENLWMFMLAMFFAIGTGQPVINIKIGDKELEVEKNV